MKGIQYGSFRISSKDFASEMLRILNLTFLWKFLSQSQAEREMHTTSSKGEKPDLRMRSCEKPRAMTVLVKKVLTRDRKSKCGLLKPTREAGFSKH